VLVLGFSSIVANAISVGAGEYLSSKAHREFVQAEKRRELWEFKNYRADEIKEAR
jgi:DNA damage-binding protein 1